jgi:hypothetical protein
MSIDLPIQIVIICQTAKQNNMLDCNTCTVSILGTLLLVGMNSMNRVAIDLKRNSNFLYTFLYILSNIIIMIFFK